MKKKNIVVIGGGPAGYTSAIRASQLGARVTLIEQEEIGGACLNRACIPTKYLLRSVEITKLIKDSKQYGINVVETGIDVPKLQSSKDKMISTIKTGLAGVIEMNGIEVIKGFARLTFKKNIEVLSEKGVKYTINPDKIICATGSRPITLNIPGIDSQGIMFAEDIPKLNKIPKSMVIIGAGTAGVEMGTILAKMGCEVTLVEKMSRILSSEDTEITMVLEGVLKRDGIKIYTGAKINTINTIDGSKQAVISMQNIKETLTSETIAIAVGYRPRTDELGLGKDILTMSNGSIKVDGHMQTSSSGIFAAGDVTGGTMLAHVAMLEGRVAAENAMGCHSIIDYKAVPRCVFTIPEIACVGLSEHDAKAQDYHVKCGRFPLAANSAATIVGERRGMVKIVANKENNQVLGVHIIGTGAVNLIGEATVAIKLGATIDDIKNTLHAHPTVSEAFEEAAMDVNGETIHLKR